ncbi:hypothetical protein Ndes2526B_g04045 [Nannochloris sp. 'desiccata']
MGRSADGVSWKFGSQCEAYPCSFGRSIYKHGPITTIYLSPENPNSSHRFALINYVHTASAIAAVLALHKTKVPKLCAANTELLVRFNKNNPELPGSPLPLLAAAQGERASILKHALVFIKYRGKHGLYFVKDTSIDEVRGPDGREQLLLHVEGIEELVRATDISSQNLFENCNDGVIPEAVRELQNRLAKIPTEQLVTVDELAVAIKNLEIVPQFSQRAQRMLENQQQQWRQLEVQWEQLNQEWKDHPERWVQRDRQLQWQWNHQRKMMQQKGDDFITAQKLELDLTKELMDIVETNTVQALALGISLCECGLSTRRNGPPFMPAVAQTSAQVASAAAEMAEATGASSLVTPQQLCGVEFNRLYGTPFILGSHGRSPMQQIISSVRGRGRVGRGGRGRARGGRSPTDLPAPTGLTGGVVKSESPPTMPEPRTVVSNRLAICFSTNDRAQFGIIDSSPLPSPEAVASGSSSALPFNVIPLPSILTHPALLGILVEVETVLPRPTMDITHA